MDTLEFFRSNESFSDQMNLFKDQIEEEDRKKKSEWTKIKKASRKKKINTLLVNKLSRKKVKGKNKF